MSDKNEFKSSKKDIEDSPIRNLFRKDEVKENSEKKQSEKKVTVSKKNTENIEDETEFSNSNRSSKFYGFKSKFKEMIKEIKEQEDDYDYNDDEDKNKDTEIKTVVSEKNVNSESNKTEIEETEKPSMLNSFKSRFKEMITSIKQPDENYYNGSEIKDIFSADSDFVKEKIEHQSDEKMNTENNVIYSAPKKKETEVQQTDKSKKETKTVNKLYQETGSDNNLEKDIFEIVENLQINKNESVETNKKTVSTAKEIIRKATLNVDKSNINDDKLEKIVEKQEDIIKSPKTEYTDNINMKSEKSKNTLTAKDIIQKSFEQSEEPDDKKIENKPNLQKKTEKVIEKHKDKSHNEVLKNYPIPQKPKKWSDIDVPLGKDNKKKIEFSEIQKTETNSEQKTEKIKNDISQSVKLENNQNNKQEKVQKNTVQLQSAPPQKKQLSNKDMSGSNEKIKKSENISKQKTNSDNQEIQTEKPEKKQETDSKEKVEQKNMNEPVQQIKTVQNNKDKKESEINKNEADDGIKIVPWLPNNISEKQNKDKEESKENSDENNKKDTVLTYHYDKSSVPFIVMAGKFTKTVKSEYEEIRNNNVKEITKKFEEKQKVNSDKSKTMPLHKPLNVTDKIKKVSDTDKENLKEDAASGTKVNKPVVVESSVKKTENNSLPKSKNPTKTKETEVSKTNFKKSETNMKNPIKKKKSKFNIKSIFSGEEEYDPDDEAYQIIEEKPTLEDYNEEKDAKEIKSEIVANLSSVFVRTVILFFTTIISLVLAIISQCIPSLFNETIRNGWLVYAIINFVLFLTSIIASRIPIVNGLMPLRHLKGNSDTGIAVASFAAAIQSTVALFIPNVFVNGTLYIYTPIVIMGLLFNSIGRLLIILRVYDNFRFLTKPNIKFAGKIYTDIKNSEKMTMGLPSRKPIIAYMKKSKFMSNFLKLSYAPDPSEDIAAKVAPFAMILSLVCGIAYGIMTLDFVGAVSSFTLSACITTPICCLLAGNIPLIKLCRASVRGGAMVAGYETIRQFSDTNTIMIDVSQLYPKGTVVLNGIKTFKESKINDAIMAGSAIMQAVNGTMCDVFDNIIQGKKDMLPNVDSVIYEDGMGLVGWVGGQRVLIGNVKLLESHNIKIPSAEDIEKKYHQTGNETMYISMGGDLVAMFILSYNPSKEIMHELRNLEDNGVSFIVRTVDPNITQEHIAEKFSLFYRCIKILPTGLGNICHEVTSSVDDKSRAYLATRGKISSFARAISGCIKIKSDITLSIIIQYVSIIAGIVIATLISFISGFQKLGCLEILIYISLWIVALIVVPLFKKIV